MPSLDGGVAYPQVVRADIWRRPVQWWWLDVPVAASITIVGASVTDPGTGIDLVGQLALGDRRAIYADVLQLAIIFAGFSGVMFAVYLGMQGARVAQLNERVGKDLLHVWLAAILAPWVCAFVLILARVLDRGGLGSPNYARWLAYGAILVVALQMLRIIWVFYQLAMLNMSKHEPAIRTAARPARIRRRAS